MDKIFYSILSLSILTIISISVAIYGIINTGSRLNDVNSNLNSINSSLQLESENHFINIISNIKPSVVAVLSHPAHKDIGGNNVIYLDDNGRGWNLGTGFSIDSNGNILTANHLVANTTEIVIILPDGINIPISKTQNIPDLDLAILYVNSSVLPVKLQSGISEQVGMSIAFIGFPLSTTINGKNVPVETTVKGTISAVIPFTYKNQLVPVYVLGATANKGNSGGPVFSLRTGEVIGIINEKITEKEGVAISTVVNQQLINNLKKLS